MKDLKRVSYEALGAKVGMVVKSVKASNKEIIGGLSVAARMFALMTDLEDKGLLDRKKPIGELIAQTKELEKARHELDGLSDEILEACDELFDGHSINELIAALSDAAVKLTVLRDSKEQAEELGINLEELANHLEKKFKGLNHEDGHECHADCPAVRVCPKGQELFPDGKAESATTKQEDLKSEMKEVDEFKKLQDAISSGDAIATMELVSKMLVKKKDN